jgi:hypothetical protein
MMRDAAQLGEPVVTPRRHRHRQCYRPRESDIAWGAMRAVEGGAVERSMLSDLMRAVLRDPARNLRVDEMREDDIVTARVRRRSDDLVAEPRLDMSRHGLRLAKPPIDTEKALRPHLDRDTVTLHDPECRPPQLRPQQLDSATRRRTGSEIDHVTRAGRRPLTRCDACGTAIGFTADQGWGALRPGDAEPRVPIDIRAAVVIDGQPPIPADFVTAALG